MSRTLIVDCPKVHHSWTREVHCICSGLQEVANRHGILFHGFADDSQLSKHTLVNEIHVEKRTMVDCIGDIEFWCRSHGLKLSADKSDVIWLGTRQELAMIISQPCHTAAALVT